LPAGLSLFEFGMFGLQDATDKTDANKKDSGRGKYTESTESNLSHSGVND